MLTKAENALSDLETLKLRTASLRVTQAAAEDPASKGYNARLTWNGSSGAFGHGIDHVDLECDYIFELVKRLRRALNITSESDDRRRQEISRSAGSEGEGFL